MPAVAATNPPVLIGLVAGATEPDPGRLRRRDAAQPRAARHRRAVRAARGGLPGSDRPRDRPGARQRPGDQLRPAARRRRGQRRGGHALPGVRRQRARDDGAGRRRARASRAGPTRSRATPFARSVPTIWLLGSSDYSARLAAEKGMPYVFAHHFSGSGTAEALALYRASFRPSPELAEPRTFLTVNVAVAETDEEARRLALPQLQAMLTLRTGGDLEPQRLVEEAEKVELPPAHLDLVDAMAAALGDRLPGDRPGADRGARRDVRRRRGDGAPGRRRLHRHRPRPQPRPRGDAPAAGGLKPRRCGRRIRVSPPFPRKLACRPNVGLLCGASRLPGSR